METGSLHSAIPATLPDELVDTLASGRDVRIERIVSKGHCSPPGYWYDQDQQEWVLLVQGEAVLRFERDNRSVRLTAGTYVHIAAHERHRVEWTAEQSETIWLAVFYP